MKAVNSSPDLKKSLLKLTTLLIKCFLIYYIHNIYVLSGQYYEAYF